MYIHSFRAHDRVSHVKCALHVDHVLCVVRATTHIIKQVLAWNRNPTRQEWSKHLNTFYRNLFSALTGWRLATFVAGLVVCCVVAELRQDDCGQRHDEPAPPAQSLRPVHQANETLYHGRHRHLHILVHFSETSRAACTSWGESLNALDLFYECRSQWTRQLDFLGRFTRAAFIYRG